MLREYPLCKQHNEGEIAERSDMTENWFEMTATAVRERWLTRQQTLSIYMKLLQPTLNLLWRHDEWNLVLYPKQFFRLNTTRNILFYRCCIEKEMSDSVVSSEQK